MNKKMAIDYILGKNNLGIKDLSCNGKCTKCGECCSNLLPVTQNEIDIIQRYVVAKNIKPQKQVLIMQQKLQCPYFDGKKCLIYEVRPLICKEFYCFKKMDYETAQKLLKEKRIPVDMWQIAEVIEQDRKRINKI